MPQVKYSPVLEEIMERAKKLENLSITVLTAETFLVSLIDAINTGDIGEAGKAELDEALEVFKSRNIDIDRVRESLSGFITVPGALTYSLTMRMRRAIYTTKELAAQKNREEITSADLLVNILDDPSDELKSVISGYDGAVPQNDAGSEVPSDSGPKAGDAKKPTPSAPKAAKSAEDKNKREIRRLIDRIKDIRKELSKTVFGQDNAINTFVTGYFQASMLSMIDPERSKPKATFLFAGPPGVGKTFLAETAAKILGLPFRRFDMSEYADKEANIEFCGSDKVYKNAKEGNVTSFVEENPQCVLLFDEIEKAHSCVIHLFLQLLDAGRLRDNYTDKEVSFRNAIIFFTTNAGRSIYDEGRTTDFSSLSRKVIINALRREKNPETGVPFFPDAMCSRFAAGNVVMFNHITAFNLRSIARKEIERQSLNLEKEAQIRLEVDDKVYAALLYAQGSEADARTIKSRAESFFNDELYELMRLLASDRVRSDITSLEKIRIVLDLSKADDKIKALYENREQTKVLVFAGEETAALCAEKLPGYSVTGVHTLADAIEALKEHEFDFALVDLRMNSSSSATGNLNIEDDESDARSFLQFVHGSNINLVHYLLETGTTPISEEERISFTSQGVRGVLRMTRGRDGFAKEVKAIAEGIYQQKGLEKLARANKLISFETAQKISRNGKNAEIRLFDFKMSTAVDTEDAKNVLSAVSKPDVRFDEVIGADDAKKELMFFVEYLRNPRKYMDTGLKAPKGILLYGPPGTGKTMLAKAMACESDVTFIAAEGNQFLKRYVGEGSEKVHELFTTARKYAPSILFIDEIDAIAKERKGADGTGAGGEETLTAFLTEMDGFINDPTKPVFVLAATNFEVEPGRGKSLDPALMRRFDRRVYIDLPDKEGRIRFLNLKKELNKALVYTDEKIENIAMRSTGMSLAELDSVIELALRSAIRQDVTAVTDEIFEDAFETFNSGEVKKWDISQLERVARHEAGHAFLCWASGETPSYLTIVARGDHGGYMQHADQEGKAIYTREELLSRIRVSLGGRAAEIEYYGEKDGISTGASGDLASATATAQRILCAYGMDKSFGLAVIGSGTAVGDALADEIREAVNRILNEQMEEALRLIRENRQKMDALVDALLNKNHMTGAEIEAVLGSAK